MGEKPMSQSQSMRAKHASSLVGILAIAVLLIFILFRQALPGRELKDWERILFDFMFFYLIFIFLRSAILVLLSFADWFFQQRFRPLTEFPLVSVIIPCFNEEKVVKHAIASSLKLDYPNFEVLVVDDGSTDLTFLSAKEMEVNQNVRVIYQKNAGKSAALNTAIAQALGDYVLNVDADSILDPNVIRLGIPYFLQNPNLAAVAGSVVVGNRKNNLLTLFQRLEYIVGLNFHKTAQSFLSIVSIVPGPVGLFRRNMVLEVGGYADGTFAEDCDLTIRLLMKGHDTAYCSKMIAITEAPDDFESLLKQRYRWSRGTAQAIFANIEWLAHPFRSLRNFAILFYLFLETLFIPCTNFLFVFLFLEHALFTGHQDLMGAYFLQLCLLDVILTTYSVLLERQMVTLVLLATINRLTYGLSMEVLRFFSILDEVLGLPMNWNKLERKGL